MGEIVKRRSKKHLPHEIEVVHLVKNTVKTHRVFCQDGVATMSGRHGPDATCVDFVNGVDSKSGRKVAWRLYLQPQVITKYER